MNQESTPPCEQEMEARAEETSLPIALRMREGKPGGGKGPLMSEDQSLTLATANDQVLFIDAYAVRGSSSPNQHPVSDEQISDALDTTGPGAVAYGIDAQAWSRSGDAETLSPDAGGRMRLRPPGLGVHEELSPTVTAAIPHAVAYRKAQKAHDPDDCERWVEDEVTKTLDAAGHAARTASAIAFHITQDPICSDPAPAMGTESTLGVLSDVAVRRLTPRECERLQGFPDDWTDGQKDSTRYRQLGNAVAVPVAEWIANRIRTHGHQPADTGGHDAHGD